MALTAVQQESINRLRRLRDRLAAVLAQDE
jgi:hypothetical protein